MGDKGIDPLDTNRIDLRIFFFDNRFALIIEDRLALDVEFGYQEWRKDLFKLTLCHGECRLRSDYLVVLPLRRRHHDQVLGDLVGFDLAYGLLKFEEPAGRRGRVHDDGSELLRVAAARRGRPPGTGSRLPSRITCGHQDRNPVTVASCNAAQPGPQIPTVRGEPWSDWKFSVYG